MPAITRIGNAAGFWGDSLDAAARLVAQQPDLDYLTLDYLAEVSMSILAGQRQRDPARGYAADFVEVVRSLAPFWKQQVGRADGRRLRVVTNAGGLNPRGCADACRALLCEVGCTGMRIGIVTGDDVLPIIRSRLESRSKLEPLKNLETGESIADIADRLVTANAYIGAPPIVECLTGGADLVITGRVADPSLTVAPCVKEFGWSAQDYDQLAGATVAGHLIECGAQVTGGISTAWLDVPSPEDIGFPVIEVAADGSCVVTKPPGTGGRVNERTVKEQLLYEIGDPDNYLSPDATVSFLSLLVEDQGNDRVRVSGAKGRPPPGTLKVSATYRAGFKASGSLTIVGRDAVAKAERCAEIVKARLQQAGTAPSDFHVECLGAGDAVPVRPRDRGAVEVVLRLTAADERREVVERFTRELMPLVTAGPQGITGYAEGRPRVHEVFGYWPCLIERDAVDTRIEMLDV